MKKVSWSTILLVAILVAGVSLLVYPSFSDYWNSFHQSRAIATYAEKVEEMKEEDYTKVWEAAQAYNASIIGDSTRFNPTEEQTKEYNEILNVSGTGVIGYIEIPMIKCSLPIYHGTEDTVLQIAIGHIEGSSLPIGGESTHCVLSGHRGLPSAKLFSDLDKLVEGDIFMIRVLNETVTYEVDQIRIVLPDEIKDLEIEEGKDYCTLVTCTPYGVNSHRLLVRGHRIENPNESSVLVPAEALQVDTNIVSLILAVPMLLGLLIWMLIYTSKH